MSSPAIPPPSVLWAQRSGYILLTFSVECASPDIKFEKQSVTFKGICAPEQKLHEVYIPLYGEIEPDKSKIVNKGRSIEAVLYKVDQDAPFWPNLTNDKKKPHWLKVDFNKWIDEDESEEDIQDMNDMFSSRMGDFGDDNEKEDSSSEDDEDLPDLN